MSNSPVILETIAQDLKDWKVEINAYPKGLDGAVIFAPFIKEIAHAVALLIKP